MTTSQKKQAPIARLPRYLGIAGSQAIKNREYFYFWLIGTALFIYSFGSPNPYVLGFSAVLSAAIGLAGIASVVRHVDKAFESLGLSAPGYGSPTWIVEGKYPASQDVIRVRAAGFGENAFESKREELSSRLSQPIKAIRKSSANVPIIDVELRRSYIPRILYFSKLDLSELKGDELFIGQSDDGIEKISLSKMIHLLVAGTTGGGKTFFLRQLMAVILARIKSVHVCLIDMKSGIDFQEMKDAPNFELAGDLERADQMLSALNAHYELRKSYMKNKNKNEWRQISIRDLEKADEFKGKPIGPIVVFVDELAVLVRRSGDNAAKSDLQRKLIDIGQMGRHANIHLILSTQRPDKTVINMQTKDVISVRVCFSVPSVTASTLVVEDMTASTIGLNPGRAVFRSDRNKIVQTPLIRNSEIQTLIDPISSVLKEQKYDRRILPPEINTLNHEQAEVPLK